MKEELEKENKKLKEQIEYLKKDKYLNQIIYERDIYKSINKELEELCNKYEEEHKTTFEIWKRDIKIIDELEKYLKEQVFNKAGNSVDLAIENHSYCKVLDKLNELKGE